MRDFYFFNTSEQLFVVSIYCDYFCTVFEPRWNLKAVRLRLNDIEVTSLGHPGKMPK